MALTLDEIYDRNQFLNAITKIELKRRNTNDTYEASWSDVEELTDYPIIMNNTVTNINYKLPNDYYKFGAVEVPDCKLAFSSLHGEFADENDSRSIFYGYVRHRTQVKISYGYVDSKTGDESLEEVYRGFINDESAGTKIDSDNTIQYLQIEDMLTSLLKQYTFADISPTEVNLEDIVYEVMNRSEFTDFLSVSAGNIDAGYNVQNISYTTGTDPTWTGNTQIINFLAGLSVGHSFFYQREGVFYYQPIEPAGAVLKTFDDNKIVKYMNYERGIDKVYEKLYWEGTNTSWFATTIKYNKTLTINVKGVNNYSQRVAYLTAIGVLVSKEYDGFIIQVPLYPKVYVADRIQVIAGGYETPDSFILDKSRLDVDYLREYLGANQSDDSQYWMVKEVKHNFTNMITEVKVRSF